MRTRIVAGVLVAFAVALWAPRAARACGRGGYSYGGLQALAVGATVIGVGDIVMTIGDAASLLGGATPSAGYGIVEIAVAAPQLMFGLAGMRGSNGSGFFTGYTIWMAALTAHGIWSIAASPRTTAPPLGGGGGAPPPPEDASALQLSVGATYAPVGQFIHPGFGLVGRF